MSDQVRVGVVGTSRYADFSHLPGVKSHPRAQLAAICGRNRDRADEMAAKYEIPQVFTDYREMIAKGSLDALVVATPDDLHYPITMAALDAGLHVLCEKPLALNASQAREMLQKAEEAGVVHMPFFTYRWVPHYRYLKQLVQEGYIGRCFHCHIRCVAGYGRRGQYLWRFDRSHCNGTLGDLGSHMVDLARWYVGDVARVSAHLGVYVDRPGPEGQPLDPANDAAVLLLEFENGAQGMIQMSAVAHVADRAQEQHIVLHGEGGTLEADLSGSGGVIHGARHDEQRFQTLPVPDDLWGDVDRTDFRSSLLSGVFLKQSVADRLFIDAILEGRQVSPSFYDGWKAQEVIDAAIESHEKGAWVSLKRE